MPELAEQRAAHAVEPRSHLGEPAVTPARRGHDHQPAHQVRVLDRAAQHRAAAQRQAEQVRLPGSEVLHDPRYLVPEPLPGERACDVPRVPVSLQLDRDRERADATERDGMRVLVDYMHTALDICYYIVARWTLCTISDMRRLVMLTVMFFEQH
jgi:hypothetical protein